MKCNRDAKWHAGICVFVVLSVGFGLGCLCSCSSRAESQSAPAAVPPQTASKPAWNRVEVDLGDGMMLRESVHRTKDGQVDTRMSMINRDGKPLVITIWKATTKNEAGHTLYRTFHKDGVPVFGESDEDGDGFFEWLMLSGEDGTPQQVFDLHKDGRFVVNKEQLKKLQKALEWGEKFVKPVFDDIGKAGSKKERKQILKQGIEKALQNPPEKEEE